MKRLLLAGVILIVIMGALACSGGSSTVPTSASRTAATQSPSSPSALTQIPTAAPVATLAPEMPLTYEESRSLEPCVKGSDTAKPILYKDREITLACIPSTGDIDLSILATTIEEYRHIKERADEILLELVPSTGKRCFVFFASNALKEPGAVYADAQAKDCPIGSR